MVAAAVVEVGEELEQLDKDHACRTQRYVVDDDVRDAVGEDGVDEVEDVVGGGEDATMKRITGGDATK